MLLSSSFWHTVSLFSLAHELEMLQARHALMPHVILEWNTFHVQLLQSGRFQTLLRIIEWDLNWWISLGFQSTSGIVFACRWSCCWHCWFR
jgi:hypothetical protein